MAKDLFGYSRVAGGSVLSTTDSILTFSGAENPVGLLIQNWNVNYQQDIREVFELGSSAVYWMKGRPSGSGTIRRIVGAKGYLKLFGDKAYDVCEGGVDSVQITSGTGGCDKGTPVTLTLSNLIVVSVGFSSSAGDTMLNEDISFRFGSLDVK